ncbi:hypothetical protein [Streptomyces sp. MBT27]|uniref:hypothetical protein n=1 Tax=Streptomyces sp. MBT27 TaxID=1488356 RepID=UPI00141E7087|nr:hypothetical protein [Streptomyces sp. MBT27]
MNDASAWQMTVEGFVHALSEAFPEVSTKYRTSSLRGNSVVDFEVEVQPGSWVEGVATTPVENSAVITVVGAAVAEGRTSHCGCGVVSRRAPISSVSAASGRWRAGTTVGGRSLLVGF